MLQSGGEEQGADGVGEGYLARTCAACSGKHSPLSARGVCVTCLTKLAQFDAMSELLDDAMVGTERVAVHFPMAPLPVGELFEPLVAQCFDAMRMAWVSFPAYEGDLADIDHLTAESMLPSGDDAQAYRELLPSRWGEFRLVPKHVAKALGLLDFHLYQLLRGMGRAITTSSPERRVA